MTSFFLVGAGIRGRGGKFMVIWSLGNVKVVIWPMTTFTLFLACFGMFRFDRAPLGTTPGSTALAWDLVRRFMGAQGSLAQEPVQSKGNHASKGCFWCRAKDDDDNTPPTYLTLCYILRCITTLQHSAENIILYIPH